MYTKDNTRFSVDWLNCRLDVRDLEDFFADFCSSFRSADGKTPITREDIKERENGGVCFYKLGYYLPACGLSSVVFAYNVDSNGNLLWEPGYRTNYGVLVSVSGDGCRYLNSLIPDGMRVFMEFLTKYNPHCTRIDIACDFLDKDNGVVPMIQEYAHGAYDRENSKIEFTCGLSRDKSDYCQIFNVYDKDVNGFTENVQIGTHRSEKGLLRLYNKKVEVQNSRLSSFSEDVFKSYNVSDYWYRLEYVCKSFAPSVFDCVVNKGIEKAYLFGMCAFGMFIENRYSGSNSDKCPVVVAWQEFYNFIDLLVNEDFTQSGEFSSVVSMPYVRKDVKSTMIWAERNAGLLAKVINLFETRPDYADRILDLGATRLQECNRYKPWLEDFNHCCINGFPDYENLVSDSVPEQFKPVFGGYTKVLSELC